jgi:ribose 5-phosphate isomerase A
MEKAKKLAALQATKHVKDGFVVGLGSGSTAAYAIAEIGRRIREEEIEVLGVPTSSQAFFLAVKNDIPTTTLNEHPVIDLTIDGADQVDEDLNLIKGMGGALTREKIVASCSKEVIIIVDETKLVKTLGENQPVPIEVLPFALRFVISKIEELEGIPKLREGKGKVGPTITDNGNYILDVDFGQIKNPIKLNEKLKVIPGVIETGLFVRLADIIYVGKGDGKVTKLKRRV